MHRRSFLVRCGAAAVGTALLPVLTPLAPSLLASDLSATAGTAQLTPADRKVLRLLSAYGTDVYFWGGSVFANATGLPVKDGTTHLLVQVLDYGRLVAFLRSDAEKTLGKVRVTDSTLSFTFQGTPYTVTNEGAEGFAKAAAGGGVSRRRVSDGEVALFTYQTLLYHPATDMVSDPHLLLKKHRVELAEEPKGGLQARLQTLVDGWLASQRYGLKMGKKFTAFQDDLLASVPTDKAAGKVVKALLENISALAGAFDVESLRPLLTSPLVSASLQSELGLDADEVLAKVETLRADLANGDYTDAALWLATLLGSRLTDASPDGWLELLSGDETTDAATKAALPAARRLVKKTVAGSR